MTPNGSCRHGAVDAVLLDVGGVILVPDFGVLADDFLDLDVHIDADDLRRAHYFGMAALDESPPKPGEWGIVYAEGILNGLGVEGRGRHRLRSLLRGARRLSDANLWTSPVPGSAAALLALSGTGVGIAFVSNSDGTAARRLKRLGISQVGLGDGVEVAAIIESKVVGVAKPDPAIFDRALEVLEVDRRRTIYVGDSRMYDVEGARAAGLTPIHFDPFGLCTDSSHHAHARDLTAVVDMVTPHRRPREKAWL